MAEPLIRQEINITVNSDVTLYAQWTPLPTFSVTYNPNGGTGGTTDADITSGTQYTVKSDTEAGVTRTGYHLCQLEYGGQWKWNNLPGR